MTKDSRLEGEEADVQRDLDSEDMRFSSHRKKSESSSDGEEGYVSVDDNENSSKASELEMSLLEDLARCSINRPTQKLDVKAITKSLDQCKIGNVKSLFDSTGKEASRKNKHDVKSDKNQLKTNDTEVKTKDKPKIDIADVLFRKMNAKISKAAVSKDSKESPDKITPKDKVKTVSKDVARAAPENYNCEIMIRTTKGKDDSSNGSNKVICVTITKGSKSDGDSKSDSKEMVQAKKGGKNLFLLSRGPVARRSIADSFSPYTRTQVNQWSGGEIVLSKELTTTPATLPLIANTLLNNSFSYTHPFNLLADNFTGSFNATIGDDSLRIQAWEGQTNQTTTDLDFSQISAKELVLIHNLIDKIINAKDLGTTHNLIDELNRLTPAIYSTKSVNTFEISNEDSDSCHIMRKTRFDTYVSQSSDNSDASFEEFHSSNSSNGPNSDDYSSPVNQWINSPDQCYLSPNTERIENNVQYNLYGESFAEELKPPSAKIDENLFNEMFFDLDMTNRITNDADILSSSMLPDYNQILLQPAQNIGQTFDNVVLQCDDTKSSFSGDETKDERIREITSQLEAIAGNLAPTTQESVYRNSKFVQILPKDLKCCNTNKKSATKALDESFEKLDTNLKVLMSTKVHSLSEESVPMLLDCLLLKWNNPDEIKFHRLPYMYMICTRLLMQASTARKFFKPYANGHTVLDRAILTCAYPLLTTFLAECSIKAKKKLLEEANEEYFIDNYDSSGNGILHRAVLGGAKCVNSLTGLLDLNKEEQFIDVERTNNDGYTALHLACGKHVSQSGEFKCSCLCMTHVLLEHGNVNPNTKDRMSGNTALHTAVTNHSCAPQLVDCLLRYKADTSLKNYKASTPLDFAKSVSRSSKSSPTKIVVDLMKQQMNVGARQRANKT